jgi:hypothetical protein
MTPVTINHHIIIIYLPLNHDARSDAAAASLLLLSVVFLGWKKKNPSHPQAECPFSPTHLSLFTVLDSPVHTVVQHPRFSASPGKVRMIKKCTLPNDPYLFAPTLLSLFLTLSHGSFFLPFPINPRGSCFFLPFPPATSAPTQLSYSKTSNYETLTYSPPSLSRPHCPARGVAYPSARFVHPACHLAPPLPRGVAVD